ncbi:Calcium-binding and coiled-coil domain-containing protein 2 [Phytophthora citrophthora]|uniref:Calcium-binding and coiled-coil domain-containing protein 2 n=1 Tax=Phytophthora citrophthora TaxID=4793 RepID=A0AAD9GVH8_9STRA|nr:Calcium-binding and coiled-coil domain-containing protein 2 [Phytophthora citrophthora]
MADSSDAASSNGDDQHYFDEEGGPAWETAPDNDEDEVEEYSDRSGHDVSDGDFEDAWFDDYLPDSADTGDDRGPIQHLEVIDSQEEDDRVASRRSSLAFEEDTTPSLLVVDAAGEAVANVSSPRLAALRGNSFTERSSSVDSEPSSPAMIHPIPDSVSVEKPPLTPLSPSTSPYKRANSLFVGPPSNTTTKILLAQPSDDSHSGLSRPKSYSQVWDSAETTKRTSSRRLDEWKRKEMWQDLKRAEEHVVAPVSTSSRESEDLSPSRLQKYKRAASDARLDTLLQTLQAEVAAPSRREEPAVKQRKESRRSPLRRRNSSHTGSPGSESDQEPVSLSRRSRTSRTSVASSSSSNYPSSPLTLTTVPVVSSPSPVSTPPSVPLSEYEQLQQEKKSLHHDKQILQQEKQTLQQEKQLLRAEVDKVRDDSAADQDRLRHLNEKLQQLNEKMAQLSEKQLQLDAMERENRSLKEETQKHEMQALSSNELVKTLRDQLTLTSKSEEQLKLQTKQLMEQNQSLQADLLEKIASETSKFQKMAKLSAENESLVEELERKENAMSERELEERQRMRSLVFRDLLRFKVKAMLRSALFHWSGAARQVTSSQTRALTLLSGLDHCFKLKLKAAALRKLKHVADTNNHVTTVKRLQESLDAAKRDARFHRILLGVMHLDRLMDHWEHRQAAKTFFTWKAAQRQHTALSQSLGMGVSKLQLVLAGQQKTATRRSLSKWQFATTRHNNRGNLERAQQLENSLTEAKECVFSLSRAKTKLEEKLQASRDEVQRLTGELTESGSELQLVKHGFVTTVIRDAERAWLRTVLSQWRIQTHVSAVTKELRLQVEMAELKAAERDKYSKSLDDYSRVLRSDLERFQFFSLDKRITVDVLSKKLLREEERYRHMEERHVALEEKAHALKTQLASFVEWDGLVLPFSVLALCKDVAVSNLRELFQLHAAVDTAGEGGSTISVDGEAPSPRLAMSSLVRILEYSTLLEEKVIEREALAERLKHQLPPYAVERGLLFADFVTGLNQFLTEIFASSNTKHEQLKRFWASLLSLLGAAHGRGGATGGSSTADNVNGTGETNVGLLLGPSRAAWAGHLSDEILQNQEKLLAVLEHETAVVERAVMEKASLKHTYLPTHHSATTGTRSGSVSSSTFLEYQCDPLLPPGSPSHSASAPVSTNSANTVAIPSTGEATGLAMEAYANWHLAPQVRDLFMAFHTPLLKLLVQYSGSQRTAALGNQYCLPSTAVFRMFTDLKLHPTFLSKEFIQTMFDRYREPGDVGSGLIAPQGFTLLLGSCALELYARSLSNTQAKPEFLLSAREVLLSFFGDLGLLAESEMPPAPKLCFVGTDVETILWPLFEYYAKVDASANSGAEDTRVGMTSATFERFMADIAGKAAGDSRTIFCRVIQDLSNSLQGAGVKDGDQQGRMRLDEFYVAISYVQIERSPGVTYATPGEAVRQWLQQTQ